jgi:hypothetical protein
LTIRQPWLGLSGLLFVLPAAAVLAFAGGPETVVVVIAALAAGLVAAISWTGTDSRVRRTTRDTAIAGTGGQPRRPYR